MAMGPLKRKRTLAGSGLGLAIVSEYARLLGVQVSMQGETPSGLRVSLTFAKTSAV